MTVALEESDSDDEINEITEEEEEKEEEKEKESDSDDEINENTEKEKEKEKEEEEEEEENNSKSKNFQKKEISPQIASEYVEYNSKWLLQKTLKLENTEKESPFLISDVLKIVCEYLDSVPHIINLSSIFRIDGFDSFVSNESAKRNSLVDPNMEMECICGKKYKFCEFNKHQNNCCFFKLTGDSK
jgi:hypothetical protein